MGKALAKPSNQREGGNGQGAVEDEKVSDGRDKDDKACPRGRRVRRAAAGPPPGQARTQPSATGVYSSAGCACCGCRGRRGGVPPPPVAKAGWAPDPSRGCHTASAAAGGVDREGPNGSPVCGALLGDTRVGGSFWYGGGLEIAPPTKLPPAQRLIGHPCGAHTREASTC